MLTENADCKREATQVKFIQYTEIFSVSRGRPAATNNTPIELNWRTEQQSTHNLRNKTH